MGRGLRSAPHPLKRQRLVNHDDDTSVVVIFPTAIPTSIPTPVTRIAIVAIRSSVVARRVNAEAILYDYRVLDDALWDRFNGGAVGTRYRSLANIFSGVM